MYIHKTQNICLVWIKTVCNTYVLNFFLFLSYFILSNIPEIPRFRIMSLAWESVCRKKPSRLKFFKISRPCASSPLPPPSISSTASPYSETQRYLFRKGKKLKNQISYHPNHLCSLSAVDSVSSTSSPESSKYAVKVSPAENRLLFLSNRISRFILGNWCLSKGKGESN